MDPSEPLGGQPQVSPGLADRRPQVVPFGPTFAFRARTLWGLGGAIGLVTAFDALAIATSTASASPAELLLAAILAGIGVACLAARRALGRSPAWMAIPSLVLGGALLIGGLVREIAALTGGSVTIPLDAIGGLWLLAARDRPRPRLHRPMDWRTAALIALVIVIELPNVTPALPAGAPWVDSLTAGPDGLDLSLELTRCDPQAQGSKPVTVGLMWRWRGFDLGSLGPDAVGLDLAGPPGTTLLQSEGTDFSLTGGGPAAPISADSGVGYTLPQPVDRGQIGAEVVPQGDGPVLPLTVTAHYRHGSRWEVTKTVSCAP